MRLKLAPVAIALIMLPSACQRTSVSEGKKESFERGSSARAVPAESSQREEKGEQEEPGEEPAPFKPTLPENFPEDIPVYPRAEPVASIVREGELNIGFRTTDPSAQVVKFYQESLRANGWRIKTAQIPGAETLLRGEKGDRRCEVSIAESESMTLIGVAVSRGDVSPENKKSEGEGQKPGGSLWPQTRAVSRLFSWSMTCVSTRAVPFKRTAAGAEEKELSVFSVISAVPFSPLIPCVIGARFQ